QEIWERNKKSTQLSINGRLDWQRTLTRQQLRARLAVLYNRSGTNLVAAVVRPAAIKCVGVVSVSGFISDSVTYRYYPTSKDEAHYLVGCLNSNVVNQNIKPYQTQGLWGERDIHRRPFEVCSIPRFDPKNPLHIKIAAIAAQAERRLKRWLAMIGGTVAQARATARGIVRHERAQLDDLVAQLLAQSQLSTHTARKRHRFNPHDMLSFLL
ncbi:hypothetical protein FJY63_12315, partial [Candidatus Sumerlaeota bacterium]|nr:hypothetical protein [Candidatus Sumerlaeota bacterium]